MPNEAITVRLPTLFLPAFGTKLSHRWLQVELEVVSSFSETVMLQKMWTSISGPVGDKVAFEILRNPPSLWKSHRGKWDAFDA